MLTIAILAKDEVKHLEELLKQLNFADHILIIADGDHKLIAKLAKKYGAQYFTRNLNHDWAAQRNFALKQIKTKWTLFLDPDERLSPELVKSIKSAIKKNHLDGYAIRRINIFEGKEIWYGEAGQTWHVRLGRTKSGVWYGSVHEVWQLDNVGKLAGVIWHYSHEDWQGLIRVIPQYAMIEAESRFKAGRDWSLFEAILYPPLKLVRSLFWLQGIRDGLPGIKLALLLSWHSFLVRYYLWRQYYPARKFSFSISLVVKLFWLSVLTIPFGQLLRFEQFDTPIYAHEALMLLVSAFYFLNIVLRRLSFKWPQIASLLFLWWLSLGLSLLLNLPSLNSITPVLYLVRLTPYGLYFLTVFNLFDYKLISIDPRRLLLLTSILFSLSGWVQFLLWPDTRFLYWLGWDDHLYRMLGTLFDPGFFGLFMGLGLLSSLNIPIRRNFITIILLGGALILSFSRSSYLSFIIALFIYGVLKRKWRLLISGLGSFFISLIFVTILANQLPGEGVNLSRTFSIQTRINSNLQAIREFKENYLYGIGFNRYPELLSAESKELIPYHPSSPDNSLLLIAVTSGLVGLFTTALLFHRLWQIYRYQTYVIASLTLILVHMQFNNTLFYPFTLWWLALLLSKQSKFDHSDS